MTYILIGRACNGVEKFGQYRFADRASALHYMRMFNAHEKRMYIPQNQLRYYLRKIA